jgi:uncharacterized RDD family membrane protein YckC
MTTQQSRPQLSGVSPMVAPELRARRHDRAGIATRLGAAVVDVVVVIIAVLVGYFAVVGVRFMLAPRHFRLPAPSLATVVSVACVVMAAYLAAGWALTGRTYGDQVFGLRVVAGHDTHPAPVIAALRAVAYVILPIGLLWVAISRENRSLQDVALRTSVVYDWD